MARPTKNEHEKKTVRLPYVRVTAAERIHVDEQAAKAGMSSTEYVYSLVTTRTVTPRKTKLEASYLTELNRVGVNLNQIARTHNAGREIPASLQYVIDELQTLMLKIGAEI